MRTFDEEHWRDTIKCVVCGRGFGVAELRWCQYKREDEVIWETGHLCVGHIEYYRKKGYTVEEIEQ